MLNREKHQLLMGQILKDIYTDVEISSLLGFKGGTAAYFLYGLPRFSVDLDFDLLSFEIDKSSLILEKIVIILGKYGSVKDQCLKKSTIFAWLSYGDDDHNIKVEINTRKLSDNIRACYEVKEYIGIPLLVARQDYLFAGKLLALTLRKEIAPRDVFDIHYFAVNNWPIDKAMVENISGQNLKNYLSACIDLVESIKDSQIMLGLGELIETEKEKDWVRQKLRTETIFMLKNYLSVLR